MKRILFLVLILVSFSYSQTGNPNPIIPDFQVNEPNGTKGARQYSPVITNCPNGNYMVTWTDERNWNSEIYAQPFSVDGNPVGANFKIDNPSLYRYEYDPDYSNFMISFNLLCSMNHPLS